jgi:hypothetical protein
MVNKYWFGLISSYDHLVFFDNGRISTTKVLTHRFRLFSESFRLLDKIAAANLEILRTCFPSLCVQAAAWFGMKSHCKFSNGRFAWKDSTAALTPDSNFIFFDIFSAEITASGVRQYRIALARLRELRDLNGIGAGPAPAAATMPPQNGWLRTSV